MPTEAEYAWAAGIIDGEGWFGAVKNRSGHYSRTTLTVSQASRDGKIPEVVLRLKDILDGGIYGPRPPSKLGKYPTYIAVISHKQIQIHLESLWAHLTEVKRAQYRAAVSKVAKDKSRIQQLKGASSHYECNHEATALARAKCRRS